LGAFLEEHTIAGNENSVKSGELYEAYKRWAEASNEFCLPRNALGRKLKERGIIPRMSDARVYIGIKLRDAVKPGKPF
jgi:putative DNA primase/helicase